MVIEAGGTPIGACCWPVDRSRVAPLIRMAELIPKIIANMTFKRNGINLRRLIGNNLRCLPGWHQLEYQSQPNRFTAGVCKQQANSNLQESTELQLMERLPVCSAMRVNLDRSGRCSARFSQSPASWLYLQWPCSRLQDFHMKWGCTGKEKQPALELRWSASVDRSDKVIQPATYSPGEILILFQPPLTDNSVRQRSLELIVLSIPVSRAHSTPERCPDRIWPIGRAAPRSACLYRFGLDFVRVRTDRPAAAPGGRVRCFASMEYHSQGSDRSLDPA